MNIKKVLAALFVIVIMFTHTVTASEVTTDMDFGIRKVTVTGKEEKAAFNRLISIEVTKDDNNSLVHIGTIKTKADGGYTYSFVLPPDATTGYYNIALGVYGQAETIKTQIYYASQEDIDALLSAINTAADDTGVKAAIDANFDILNISKEWYDNLNNKIAIANNVKVAKPVGGYTDIPTLKDEVYKGIAIYSFSEANTGEKIEAELAAFADYYDISETTVVCLPIIDTFGLTSDRTANKEKIYDIMARMEPNTLEGIRLSYGQSVLLNAINCAKDPDEIKTYLEKAEYEGFFGTELLTKYKGTNREKTVKDIFAETEIKSMKELKEVIEASYQKQQDSNKDGTGPSIGGNSSGGGSSSGGGGAVIPALVTQNISISSNNKFTDLGKAEWAKTAIIALEEKGIISGMGDGCFAPNDTVTREQFAQMIVKAFSLKNQNTSIFRDISKDHWAFDAINTVYSCGIVNGISATEFGVGMNISRQDMAVMIYRAAKYAGYDIENGQLSFSDNNNVSEYASEAVAALNRMGVINGYPDGTFGPLNNATRAQAAQIIYTVINDLSKGVE